MADVQTAGSPALEPQPVPKGETQVSVAEDCSASPPSTAAEKAAKGKGFRALRNRISLRRSYNTKHASLSSPSLLSPTSEQAAAEGDDVTAPIASPKRAKTTPFERFINFKLASARKGGKNTKSDVADVDLPVLIEVAPVPTDSSTSASTSTPAEDSPEQVLPTVAEVEAVVSAAKEEATLVTLENTDPEPLPLAQKIQSLLSSLPPFLSFDASPNPTGGDEQAKHGADANTGAGPGIPDSRLISLLSSPSIMNGSLSRGRESVWALLDNLRLKTLKSGADAGTGTAPTQDVAKVLEDDDSVMFYAPLVPSASSSVELARSEIVSVDENGTIVEVLMDDAPLPQALADGAPPLAKEGAQQEAFKWHWPFHRTPTGPSSNTKTVEKRVWVPSTEKLSLQVMWWGYRLWLPPPVLALLNDKEIEAAKLSAMLTTALQWLLNNVPTTALPSTLRPALALVKSLVPYLGYIGGFVAWSWGAIKGFDVGYGVTLTATWLLPIALVPGTWEQKDTRIPPATPSPTTPTAPSTPAPTAPSTSTLTVPPNSPNPTSPPAPTSSTPAGTTSGLLPSA